MQAKEVMNMPRFTAEASLYHTNNHYQCVAGGSFLSDGKTTVTPQDSGQSRYVPMSPKSRRER
jgi:hypothetical protein